MWLPSPGAEETLSEACKMWGAVQRFWDSDFSSVSKALSPGAC
jgi:hypothetical protein